MSEGPAPKVPEIPAFLTLRGYRTAFAGCFVVAIIALLVHASLGHGFREPSVWSYIAAAAALSAAFGIPWLANRAATTPSHGSTNEDNS